MTALPATIIEPETIVLAAPKGVSDLFGSFLSYLDASPRTVATYAKTVRLFAAWLAARGIAEPKREDVLRYRDELAASHKPTTVRLYMVAVKMFFRWTATLPEGAGHYPNVADHIKTGRVDHSPKKDPLTTRQAKVLLEAAREDRTEKGLRDYAILALLLTAGLRTIEVVRLNVGDLGVQGDRSGFWVQGKGHGDKDTFCKLEPDAEDAIRSYLRSRGPLLPTAPLFASTANRNRGGRLTTTSVSAMVKAAFRSIGLDSPRLTAHSTRHYACTAALLAGHSIQEVAQFMRHASIDTTDIYAHNLNRLENGCGASIARALFH